MKTDTIYGKAIGRDMPQDSEIKTPDGRWVNPDTYPQFDAKKVYEFRLVSTEPENATKPKIITLCGSSRFVAESSVKAWEFNKQGIATFYMPLLPQWYSGVKEHHQAEAEGVSETLDNLWLKLIEMSDEVFVVNCGGYIGDRTRIEINHALKIGKPVNYLVPPENVIVHTDSEIGMQMGQTTVSQLPDGTWKAVCPIGSLFGSEVEGECSGVGDTKEAALDALAKDRKNLNDSLWA